MNEYNYGGDRKKWTTGNSAFSTKSGIVLMLLE